MDGRRARGARRAVTDAVRAAVPPILARLRRETAELHARAEAALPLLDAGPTRDASRGLLAAFLGFHRPLEPVLWAEPGLVALGLYAAERRRTPLLERDLRALGAAADAVVGAAVETFETLGSWLGWAAAGGG